MDYQVIWSPEATEDLDSIIEYIARDSIHYARVVASRLIETANETAQHPLIGRVVPEFNDQRIRERFVYSYRLIYKIKDSLILIIAIVHGRRLLENAPEV